MRGYVKNNNNNNLLKKKENWIYLKSILMEKEIDPENYFTFFYSSTKGSISYMWDISILKLDYELRFLNYAPYINLTLHETFWKSIYRLGGSE